MPILGADFLRHHHLLVDVVGGRLFEPLNPLPPGESLFTAAESQDFSLHAKMLSTPQAIKDLLHKFSHVVYSHGLPTSEPCHNVCHHPGPPVLAKPRRLDPEKLVSDKAKFSAMEKVGIICRSNSPLHMVKKKDGS